MATATTTSPDITTLPPKATLHPVVFDTRVVTGSGGGPDKTILTSPKFFKPLGYTMLCGYLHPPGDPAYSEIVRKAERQGAPLLSIPDRGPFDMKLMGTLMKVCREQNVKIWHGHDYKTNALGWALAKFHRMKLVTTVHGWVHHTARTPLYYKIDKWSLKKYARVYCVSQDLLDACLEFGVKPERAVLLENGIDTDEFTRQRTVIEAKAELGFNTSEILIGAAGRLEAEKAFDLLIRSVHDLRRAGLPVRLVIVGEGHDRPRLEALIRELGVGTSVTLVGWQSDVRRYFEAMDIFALSSLREGLPNVLLEAMALEVPCVATRIAGIPKLITDCVDGLLIEPNNGPELTAALKDLVQSESLRAEYRAAARCTIETRYSFAKRIAWLKEDYDRLLADKLA